VKFTDNYNTNTLEVFQGEQVKLTSTAYSYNGPLWSEILEITTTSEVLFSKQEQGSYNFPYYYFTNTSNLDTSTLSAGTYKIKFTASTSNDCSKESEYLTLIIKEKEKPDTECPIVEISSPLNQEVYEQEITSASITITEENDLDNCEYTLNGITKTFSCQKGLNTILITTKEGWNSLIINVADKSGNSCPKTINFKIEIPEIDDECPSIEMISPTNNEVFNNHLTSAEFIIYEENELEECTFTLNGITKDFYVFSSMEEVILWYMLFNDRTFPTPRKL